MKYFALRNRTTGEFIPSPRSGRPASHVDPALPDKSPPRLFVRKTDAKNALRWWLDGRSHATTSRDWESGILEVDGIETEKDPTRIADEWEIVEMDLGTLPGFGDSIGIRPFSS